MILCFKTDKFVFKIDTCLLERSREVKIKDVNFKIVLDCARTVIENEN